MQRDSILSACGPCYIYSGIRSPRPAPKSQSRGLKCHSFYSHASLIIGTHVMLMTIGITRFTSERIPLVLTTWTTTVSAASSVAMFATTAIWLSGTLVTSSASALCCQCPQQVLFCGSLTKWETIALPWVVDPSFTANHSTREHGAQRPRFN
ncbi:hypothetical protein F5Y18DRAFT_386152 [Xylariaceae sp. FL1019]|nr:hypothetical protein F5Y18DRAFT_386152 [Xylariaceae sp. FL1019]